MNFVTMDLINYNVVAIRRTFVGTQAIETFNSDLVINIGGALAAI
jgi:hypothetical protein